MFLFHRSSRKPDANRRRPHCPRPKRVVRDKARRARLRSGLSIFATIAAIAAGTVGFWQFSMPVASADTQAFLPGRFSTQGMTLGMTAQKARHLYPRMSIQWQGDGSYQGKFVADGRAHTISFAPGSHPGPVFRISYREIETRLSPEEIRARFSTQFGAMTTGECYEAQCSMKWQLDASTFVIVRSRDVSDISGRQLTALTVTATDLKVAEPIRVSRASM